MADAGSNDSEQLEKRIIGRPFKPGESGNPSGRHKMVRQFQEWLLEHAYPKAQVALKKCLESQDEKVQMIAVKEVHDRLFGKAPQPLTGEDGQPLRLDLDLIGTLQRLAAHKGEK